MEKKRSEGKKKIKRRSPSGLSLFLPPPQWRGKKKGERRRLEGEKGKRGGR